MFKYSRSGKDNPNFGNFYGKRIKLECPVCGNTLSSLISQHRKFCSKGCATIFSNKNRGSKPILIECSFCKKLIIKSPIQYRDHLRKGMGEWFCSKSCCGKFYRGKKRYNTSLSTLRVYKEGRKIASGKCLGGIKTDLGRYFRSSWEANFARILNLQNKTWKYEPQVFVLNLNGKETTYRPDFYLPDENLWIEVKGYWRDKLSLKKFNEFSKKYKSKLIDSAEYQKLRYEYKNRINWEGR